MPLQQTSGNVTADAYGGGVAAVPNYIEDVFSTWLYTGNGSTGQSITNGIDLAGKGGLTWIKSRDVANNNLLFDTNRGATNWISSNQTGTQTSSPTSLTAFNADGFTLGGSYAPSNQGSVNFTSWTFRKQPKFFDVVTYTGTGSARTIAHSLGSTPGCIIVKRTDTTGNWQVYHNGLTSAAYSIQLNLTNAQASATTVWNSTAPTSTVFSVGTDATVNASGGTYVAYIFAHNAGGFGSTGTDNVISCGSFVSSGGVDTIELGYEPQFVLYKSSSNSSDWRIADTMRGMSLASNTAILYPNQSSAEQNAAQIINPTATGFQLAAGATIADATYIYIAIRRGPMKVPMDGTKVFAPVAAAFNSTTVNNTGFVTDMVITRQNRAAATDYQYVTDRLRGADNAAGQYVLETDGTYAEAASSGRVALTGTQTIQTGFLYQTNTTNSIAWSFRRAPGFFDEVCYQGNGVIGRTVTHNLSVPPELVIIKSRSGAYAQGWPVGSSLLAATEFLKLNTNIAKSTAFDYWNGTYPTSTQITLSADLGVNASGATYVAYLFASCPGVSKVGTYTGNGTTQTINCGFAGGARFVLIKRTDSTGDWYVYDTARGMTTLTDPYLLLNSTAAESATLGSVTTVTTGFAVNASILAAINTNAASYIFLAIA